ncbi:MAG: ATP-binding cassette domain-containing protein [Bacillota bacterium]|jgi:ABC-2 type transport system ATP-binding protein|nr:ATP-binding cassette domain-containing protein [Bacillota bacterium]NLL26424.1 ATP-binding cassette domain-containing protein [Erysipelotrichia bacterium]
MLEVINLSKKYNEKEVLRNISFAVEKGTIISVLGKNGSGKTTLFKMILNLLEKDNGKVQFEKKNIEQHLIGYLPEQRSLYQDCTVYQHLKLITGINKIVNEDEKIDKWLHKMKLYEYKDKKVYTLSKGNQQKLALIVCLIKEPKIVVMDEPFTGLDYENIDIFLKEIKKLKKENKIVLISSHIYQPVNQICDRYIYLEKARIKLDIRKKDLIKENKKVIEINDKDYLYDEQILSKVSNDKMVRYIIKNNKAAQTIVERLIQENRTINYYGPLTIEDKIKQI